MIYAILVTVFVYRQMNWQNFVHATLGAVRTTAMVLLIIGTAASFSWLMAYLKVPAALIDWMNTISSDPIVILLLLNVLMLVLGTFMDMGADDHHLHADLPAGGRRPTTSTPSISASS